MNDVLNQDMLNALDAIELEPSEKEILRGLLHEERFNKNREWDDDAVEYIVKILESNGVKK